VNAFPGSTPEFRLLRLKSGETVLQVRYVHDVTGYTGLWQNVPLVDENADSRT
jgi:hypothetical protein